jgi:hypothetical protein
MENIDNLIDNCVSYNNHMEIAILIHSILKNKYKYIGNNIWEYQDEVTLIWCKDKNNIKFKDSINTIVCNEFINKSLLWLDKYNNECNSEIKYIYKCRYDSIIDIIVNFKNKKYINNIINECKQYFNSVYI